MEMLLPLTNTWQYRINLFLTRVVTSVEMYRKLFSNIQSYFKLLFQIHGPGGVSTNLDPASARRLSMYLLLNMQAIPWVQQNYLHAWS